MAKRSMGLFFCCALLGGAAHAASWITVAGVSAPQRPSKMEMRALKRAAAALPADQAAMILERTIYEIVLENTSSDKYCTSVRIEVRFLDADGNESGRATIDEGVQLRPHKPASISYLCPDATCRHAAAMEVLSVEPLTHTVYGDRWVKIRGRTWHIVDEWEADGRVSFYPFSPGYYDNVPFEDTIFAAASFYVDPEKAFRIEKVAIPASYPYPENDIAWYSAAGLLVKDGEWQKPGFFTNAGRIINTNIHGELPVGQFVHVETAEVWSKRLVGFHLEPICALTKQQRRLNSWIYFRFEPQVVKQKDTATVEAAVRPFLKPVPVAEVAKVCGPNSGTLVRHFTDDTPEQTVLDAFGEPTARRATPQGSELEYENLTIRIVDGSFAGVILD